MATLLHGTKTKTKKLSGCADSRQLPFFLNTQEYNKSVFSFLRQLSTWHNSQVDRQTDRQTGFSHVASCERLIGDFATLLFLFLFLLCPRSKGHFGIQRSVRPSVPWRSCLGYRHAGCLQLSRRRPSEMCGLRTRPWTDVDPPRFLPLSNCHRRGYIVSPPPGRYPILRIEFLLTLEL